MIDKRADAIKKGKYEIAIKVISQEGLCRREHKVGEEWVMLHKTPEGICLGAFGHVLQPARVLQFGGSFPYNDDPDVTSVACPDKANPVVFELRRLPKK